MVKELETELRVGIFVSVGVGLILLAILGLGGADSLFSRHNEYHLHFSSVEGMVTGAKVVVGGLQVGTVKGVDLDLATKDIHVEISVNRKYQDWIRKNSTGEIATQGVLGDKYVILNAGTPSEPLIADGGTIEARPPRDLSQFLTKGDALLSSLNHLAQTLDQVMSSFAAEGRSTVFFENLAIVSKNLASTTSKLNGEMDGLRLKKATSHLAGILEKIDNGTGTIGALVNDPGLYYDTKALLGGANRNRIIRNLVRKTLKDNEAETDALEAKGGAVPAAAPKK
jgi:phospholipid/cholesterol/gamma-HCH transport system substrate-binding protein